MVRTKTYFIQNASKQIKSVQKANGMDRQGKDLDSNNF